MSGMRAATRLASLALVFGSLLGASKAWAVPPASNLEPANGYGTVVPSLISSSNGRYTYLFTVTNTTSYARKPYYGIKGVIVYGPSAPIAMSQPDRTSTTLWQKNQGYSWWDMNGSEDADHDCIQDRFLEPGQVAPTTRPDLTFTLTYDHPIDVSQLSYGLHIQVPCGGTFFAHANTVVCGQVVCQESNGMTMGLPGATVQLLNANTFQVVASTTSDASGNYTLAPPAAGDYLVQASAPDFNTARSAPFHYTGSSNGCLPTLVLTPAPVTLRTVNAIQGQVFFSDTSVFRGMDGGKTLTAVDLLNPASVNRTVSCKYVGTIPSFPELGHFGGTGEKPLWVIVYHELKPEDHWASTTFTNVVCAQAGIGTSATRTPGAYTARFLCSLPCDGPGTAYNFKTQKLEVTQYTSAILPQAAPSWSDLPTVTADGQISTQAAPKAGTVPPGWMARTRFEMQIYPGIAWSAYATVSYTNVCGDTGGVTIDPLVNAAP